LLKEELTLTILRDIDNLKSQQSLATQLGISIGKVNYVLQALIEKGLVKADNFATNKSKKQYKYLLTKEGLKEKIILTEKFIEKKKQEYDMLQADLQRYEANGEYVKVKGNI